jgi:hypothetical protein
VTKAAERSRAPVEEVLLSEITVGERRRQEMGSLQGLMNSIECLGLLQPITIRDDGELVYGERRLRAFENLGRRKIPARRYNNLTYADFRDMELHENKYRKPYTEYEAGAARMREIEAGEAEAEEENETCFQQKQVREGKPGPPRQKGSVRDIANRTGIPAATIVKTRQHMAAADKYPFLKGGDWSKNDALLVGKTLDKVEEPIRNVLVGMCSTQGVKQKNSLQRVLNVSQMSPKKQNEIRQLYESKRRQDRDLAFTRSADLPPMPDPGFTILHRIARDARQGKKVGHASLRDSFAEITETAEAALGVLEELKK